MIHIRRLGPSFDYSAHSLNPAILGPGRTIVSLLGYHFQARGGTKVLTNPHRVGFLGLTYKVPCQSEQNNQCKAFSQTIFPIPMLLSCLFDVFALGRPNEFLHERHRSMICVLACNGLMHFFVQMWRKRPVVA